MPSREEVALGAVTELGDIYWNDWAESEGFNRLETVKSTVEKEIKEAQRRKSSYTKRQNIDYNKYDAIIVCDDAIATGATMKAAIKQLKHHGAKKIIVAIPCAYLTIHRVLTKSSNGMY